MPHLILNILQELMVWKEKRVISLPLRVLRVGSLCRYRVPLRLFHLKRYRGRTQLEKAYSIISEH